MLDVGIGAMGDRYVTFRVLCFSVLFVSLCSHPISYLLLLLLFVPSIMFSSIGSFVLLLILFRQNAMDILIPFFLFSVLSSYRRVVSWIT